MARILRFTPRSELQSSTGRADAAAVVSEGRATMLREEPWAQSMGRWGLLCAALFVVSQAGRLL